MKRVNRKTIIPTLLATLIVISIVAVAVRFISVRKQTGNSVAVTLTDSGFSPSVLTIRQGDTITFRSTRNKPFWPASDLHPSHETYPEFDPKAPVSPGSGWSFTFSRAGRFPFHDHLWPAFTGVITVTDKKGIALPTNCDDPVDKSKPRPVGKLVIENTCWADYVVSVLKKDGVDAALDSIGVLYANDPTFTESCHSYSHLVGREAFYLFARGRDIPLSAKTSYCGYGFFHGFMGMLLTNNPDLSRAKEFCENADKKLANSASLTRLNCYHGIGHGMADQHDTSLYGNAQAMADKGLVVCDKVTGKYDPTSIESQKCYEGIYNEYSIAFLNRERGLSMDPDDPIKFCREQKEDRQEICFHEFAMTLKDFYQDDFQKGARMIETIEHPAGAVSAMRAFGAVFVNDISKFNDAASIADCQGVRKDLVLSCIRGLSLGFIAHGQPDIEYVAALRFCGNRALSKEQKSVCYESVINAFKDIYPKDKVAKICGSVDSTYRAYCTYHN